MSDSPYTPPKTALLPPDRPLEIPADITRKIRNCGIAGLVSAAITCVFTFVALSGPNPLGLDIGAFVDAALMAGLAVGVLRKQSRACAVLMVVLFVLNKAIMWSATGTLTGLSISLVFLWFFGQGVVGTFQWYKLRAMGDAQ